MPRSNSFAVAMAYAGAVIGAGFATGREVAVFFTAFGRQGLTGVLLATVLFIWAGVTILDVTQHNPVYSYRDFLYCILGLRPLVIAADLLFLGTLLTGIGVMTAAGGTILADWQVWYPGGCALFLTICILFLRRGRSGFVKANMLLVPLIILAITLLCLLQISAPAMALPHTCGAALLYVAFNTAIAAVALATLKEHLDSKVVCWGGVGGGLIIGVLLLLIYSATLNISGQPDIPLLQLAKFWLGDWHWFYALALFAAVLTTALANLHGLACRARGKYWTVLLVASAGGFALAQFGFAKLVGFLYPLLGTCNIVLLAGLCYYSFKRLRLYFRSR